VLQVLDRCSHLDGIPRGLVRRNEAAQVEYAERDRQRRIAQERYEAWARGEEVEDPDETRGR